MSDGWFNDFSGATQSVPPQFGGGGQIGQGGFGAPGGQFGGSPPGGQFGVSPPGGQFGGSPGGGQFGVNAPAPVGQFGAPIGGSPGVSAPTPWYPTQPVAGSGDDSEEDPPLLEELGIDVPAIWMRVQGIAFFKKLDTEVVQNVDMSGPLLIVMALGLCLVLRGKFHFGFIYGFGMVGFVGLYGLINLMSQNNSIDLYSTISILGYGLIPVVLLATIAIIISLANTLGFILSILCIFWCTATTSRFFETAVSMAEQRWLIAYPISLVYTCFVLITVF